MPSTSDVISGGGGGDVFIQPGGNFYSRSSDSTALTTANFNNAIPDTFKSTNRFVKERLPDGTANGDIYNVAIHPSSFPFYFTGGTQRTTDSGYNCMAVLEPGARGCFMWDEDNNLWEWYGDDNLWWPQILNVNPAWQSISDMTAFSNNRSISAIDNAIIFAYQASNDLALRVLPFGSDDQLDTIGAATTRSVTNNVTKARIFMLSQTIGIVLYNETTANNTYAAVVTLSGTSVTLGTQLTVVSGTDRVNSIEIIPTRANATSFAMAHTDHVVDATYYPEIAYCTISGTGGSAAITRNTGVNKSGSASHTVSYPFIEDPVNDEYYWTGSFDEDGGTNTYPCMTLLQRSGTTYNTVAQATPYLRSTATYGSMIQNRLDKFFSSSIGANRHSFAPSTTQIQALGYLDSRNGDITNNDGLMAGGCGGIVCLSSRNEEGETNGRVTKSTWLGGSNMWSPHPNAPTRGQEAAQMNFPQIDQWAATYDGVPGVAADITGASIAGFSTHEWTKSELGAADNEAHGTVWRVATTGTTDKQITAWRMQIPWATRWKK